MKTKKRFSIIAVLLTSITLVAAPVFAGSKQQHRWEGVAIGLGAAILGHAIYQAHLDASQPRVVYVEPAPEYRQPRPEHHRGHWEWQKTWIAPTFEKVWNPGHYDRKGRWVPGHWIEVKTSEG
ncbi:hypothetical protein [uncultured Desulfosarcina sp.]|uniref:hypothetical protein n=1 Tax=uncultured Desulfosarcina sp. TaxID=218289 RepID=UPI0029C8C832|nr:hypothetical protein [uncultured Desulfosarcina sp.]